MLPHTAAAITALAREHAEVVGAGPVRSMYLGPGEALLILDLQFAPGVSAARAAEVADALRTAIRERYPMLRGCTWAC